MWVPNSYHIIFVGDVKILEVDQKQSIRNDLPDDLLLYHTNSECDARYERCVALPPQVIEKDNCQNKPSSNGKYFVLEIL